MVKGIIMRNTFVGAIRSIYTLRSVWVTLAILPLLTMIWTVLYGLFAGTHEMKPSDLTQGLSLSTLVAVIGFVIVTASETKNGSLPWLFSVTRSRFGFAVAHIFTYTVSAAVAVIVAAVGSVLLASLFGSSMNFNYGSHETWGPLSYGLSLPIISTLLFCTLAWITRSAIPSLALFVGAVFIIEPVVGTLAKQQPHSFIIGFIRDTLPFMNLQDLCYGAAAVFPTSHGAIIDAVVLVGWVVLAILGLFVVIRKRSVR